MKLGTSNATSRFGSSFARVVWGGVVVEPPPAEGPSLTITWENTSETAETNTIHQSPDGTTWTLIETIDPAGAAGTTGTFTATGLSYNAEYHFRVSAVVGVNSATITSSVHYTAPELAVAGVTATATSYDTVDIDATVPLDPPIAGGYFVEYYAPGDPAWTLSTTSATLPVTLSNLPSESLITARLYAYNLNGDGTKSLSPVSATVTATTEAAPAITDDFNRTDGALGASWDVSGPIAIDSNQATNTTGTAGYAFWATPPVSNDQYSEVVVGDVSGTWETILFVRINGAGHYRLPITSSQNTAIFEGDGGSLGDVDFGSAPVAGDVVRLSVMGSTIKVYFNGVVKANVTDATVTSGDYGFSLAASSGTAKVNSWTGGTAI